MFTFIKDIKIRKLEVSLSQLQANAEHFYEMRSEVEERAYFELYSLAEEKKISAEQAAKTALGKDILAEVVMHRQSAFHLNEQAIEVYCELYQLKTGKGCPVNRKDWLNEIVKPAAYPIIFNEINVFCSSIISSVSEELKENGII